MRYKILKDGETVNTIIAAEDFCKAYCEKHGYTYEVEELPETDPVEVEPTEADDTAAMLVDHEYRLTMLELGITE